MSERPTSLVVLVTAPSETAALDLGRRLVDERLAACANVVPAVTSIFVWEGKREEVSEALLLIKTRSERYAALQQRVLELHPYSVPECWRWPSRPARRPISDGSKTRLPLRGGERADKNDLINAVAAHGLSKRQSASVVESLFTIIFRCFEKGEDVKIVGFGHFRIRQKLSRRGRTRRRATASRSPRARC